MSRSSQSTRPGKKATCVLSRPPAPPALGEEAEIAVFGSRVVRLLRDARASVQARPRPDTPVMKPPQPPPKRGGRLCPMSSAASSPSPSAASHFLTSSQHIDRATFELALDAAKGAPELQLQRLGELKLWLANPQHVLWDTTAARLLDMAMLPATDPHVVMRVVAILLRCGDVRNFFGLPLLARRLHEVCEHGLDGQRLEMLLMRESLIQPLLNLLNEEDLLKRQPQVLWDVLETLRCLSRSGDAILTQLVTLGVIPGANTVVKSILSSTGDSPSKMCFNDDSFLRVLLPPLCLLYRNLSARYSHYLCKLGSLDLLVDILDQFRDDGDVVQAAARAMAKTTFEDCSLEHYRKDTRACRAAAAALENNLELSELAVSRLCGTLARLLEGSRELRDWFMHHYHRIPLQLVHTYIVPQYVTAAVSAKSPQSADDAHLEDLLQSVMWLVGVAAFSAECSTAFVLEITPLLAEFLKDLDVTKWRLTFIYTLMCLSNLSFFFNSAEKTEGGSEALVKLYATVGFILAGVIFDGDTEATVEATRVLGNMCLTNAGRDWMESNRCDEVCIVFLGHEDPRIVYNCFGVLLNLTAADTCRVIADPELMHMLLQHTGRYTRDDFIAAEKAREKNRCVSAAGCRDGDGELSYTDQIADVVEKLLLNIRDLI